jgi:hypothetical protein
MPTIAPACAPCQPLPGMGRLPHPDTRDADFPARLALRPRSVAAVASRYWNRGATLDQGPTPRCVAYSWLTLLEAGPVTNRKALPDPAELYRQAQELDEWPGSDYDGTSVRAGAKALQALGYLSAYLWAFDPGTVADWLLQHGPVVFGTAWPDSMMTPDAKGWLTVKQDGPLDGPHAAGHAYCGVGALLFKRCPDGSKGAVILQNSWGAGWGLKGTAWLSLVDMGKLLAAGGECCMPSEIKV